ncbi:class I SAM-dependent methyltransferase [Aeromicrobium ginsengisoli]|uniref:Methyltransferase domain-containing protein n=1 Tax=Aeromicrobium ginsengisoli TaxID=363867 RepID=A0A5M4FDV6_9ACTN|nr:methyltransferase domain-containing protein [Aeromicrobium ginsengisoli]KAA1396080.1 methyltransferase domain-containing protein [Aeromicrobium ginsengisoli]
MTSEVTASSNAPAPSTTGIRVNLGCGIVALPGWENYDKSPVMLLRRVPFLRSLLVKLKILTPGHIQTWPDNVQRRDLTKPLPQADGTVEAIYSSHMLEHIYLQEARELVKEAYRVMAPGGILRLALPDGELWARQLLEGQGGEHFNERINAYPVARPKGRRQITFMLGGSAHKWQPTRDLVKAMVEDAGFTNFRELAYQEGDLPQVTEVEVRPESMFFEAVRPAA